MKKALLIGLGPTALSALESLHVCMQVAGVVREETPASSGEDPVISFCRRTGIPVFTDTHQTAVESIINRLKPDVGVISSYNQIFKSEILEKCPFVNVHYAKLPQYRGRAVVNWVLINGERETAITIHAVSRSLDSGNILFQQAVPIEAEDDVTTLYEKLNSIQRDHLGPAVLRFLAGDQGKVQDPERATYACGRNPADGEIQWNETTVKIHRLIRALTPPFPAAFTYHERSKLYVHRAVSVSDPPAYQGRIPGRVVRVNREDGSAEVLTGDGILKLTQVSRENGQRIPAASLIRSTRSHLGLTKEDLSGMIKQLQREIEELSRKWESSENPGRLIQR